MIATVTTTGRLLTADSVVTVGTLTAPVPERTRLGRAAPHRIAEALATLGYRFQPDASITTDDAGTVASFPVIRDARPHPTDRRSTAVAFDIEDLDAGDRIEIYTGETGTYWGTVTAVADGHVEVRDIRPLARPEMSKPTVVTADVIVRRVFRNRDRLV